MNRQKLDRGMSDSDKLIKYGGRVAFRKIRRAIEALRDESADKAKNVNDDILASAYWQGQVIVSELALSRINLLEAEMNEQAEE